MTDKRHPVARLLRLGFRLGLLGLLLLASLNLYVVASTTSHRHDLGDAPQRNWAIVLGASVLRDGSPSRSLQERLVTTAELYKQGRVQRVLVTGDHDPPNGYSEVLPMTRFLTKLGVPRDRIEIDHFGFRTFDSMVRAERLFEVRDALVVTNPFHLARAVYLGRAAGIDCDGIRADHGVDYSTKTLLRHQLREAAARSWCLLDMHVLGTEPHTWER